MPKDDIEYYRGRERQELLAADNSTDDRCRTRHLELAGLYRIRITELEADFVRCDTDDAFAVLSPSRSTFIA